MTTLTKIFLALSVTGFITGSVVDFTNLTSDPKWTVAMPLGAVFFGLFLIFLMLQKEMAAFDQEAAKRLPLVGPKPDAPAAKPSPPANPAIVRLREKTS